jgi:hypothetical protein
MAVFRGSRKLLKPYGVSANVLPRQTREKKEMQIDESLIAVIVRLIDAVAKLLQITYRWWKHLRSLK